MYANITGETPIAALTVSQFVDLLDKHKSAPAAPSARPVIIRKVMRTGSKASVNSSAYPTPPAQRYKDTFLKPAVRQNGRKIVIDVAKALELFDEHAKG